MWACAVKHIKKYNKKTHVEPKIDIGVNIKKLLTHSNMFAGKSLFVKEIVKNSNEVTLINIQKLWGNR